MAHPGENCHICGKRMKEFKGVFLCLACNDKYGDYYNFFKSAAEERHLSANETVIECPGVTIYNDDNTRVVQGIKWNDNGNSLQGYQIVGKQIFAPGHQKTRAIPLDKVENIRRCQACQDFTVRMRIYNRERGNTEYVQSSPLMPKDGSRYSRPSIHER